ncbi:MAG: hypothetical protein DSY77_01485 [Bacteroidetes bacterium]|nr:MAG: hypothetical protein DSY77_01485 [Bacteroidota bacterium]
MQGQNGTCAPVLMNGSFSVNVQTVVAQNILNSNPADICASDDLFVSLDDSQNGVTYTVFVEGIASSVSVVSTGGQLDITLPSAEFNDGDNITVEGNIGGCPAVAMNNPFDVNIVDFTLNPTVTNTTGCAVNDGEIDLAPISDSAGDTFSFSWVGPNGFTSLSEDIAGLDGGSYTVTITSNNSGCTFDSTIVVDDPVPYTINVISINPQQTCNGSDGGIDINITGGTGPYNYYIVDTNSNTEVAGSILDNEAADTYSYNFLPPGDYEVFVEEGACIQSQTFTVNPVDQIASIVSSTTEPNCGATDGIISLEVTDVGHNFDITYDDGVNPPVTSGETAVNGAQIIDLTGLGQGTYTITITDNTTNCEVVLNQLLNENAPFDIDNASTAVTNIQTCGGTEGAIDVVVTGTLTGPTTYTWTGPTGFTNPATEDLSGLDLSGDYQLTIEDAGCTVVSNVFTITEPTPPTSVAGADSTICLPTLQLYADALGTDQSGEWQIVSQPAGAAANIIDPTSPITNIEDLFELGDYTLAWILENTITNCSDSDTIVITRKDITLADAGSDQGVCIDNTTLAANSVDVNETGIWSLAAGTTATITNPNDPSSTVTGLSEGINEFIWTISDDNLICSETTDTVTVYYDMPMEAGGSLGPISMTAVNPDTVLVDFLNGTQDPDGIWSFVSGPATVSPYGSTGDSIDFTGQVSGQYEFKYKVQDSLACSADSVNVIIDYLDFQCDDTKFSIITEDASCAGVQDGLVFFFLQNVSNAANLQAVINTTDTLTFSNPGNGNIVELDTTFLAGNYNITLYDQLTGCDSTKSIIIGQKQSITPTVEVTDADCETSLGEIQVNLDGNTFEFVLLDSTNAPLDTTTTGLFTNLTPAEYAVAVNNSGVCQVDTIRNLIIAPADSVNAGNYIGTPGEASITNSTFVLDSLLDDSQDSTGVWTDTNNVGVTISGNTVDLAGLSSGTYTFTYTVTNQNATCSDAEDVFINYDASDFTCAETKLSVLSEEATCQGVQDGTIFLFLQNVSNTDTLNLTINSVVMDTFSIEIPNPGSGSLLEIDTTFFSGNYELVLTDSANNCTDTINVLIGQKQSIIPLINTSDATCDNPVGQIQVAIDGTFEFVLLDSTNSPLDTTTTGLFTDLKPATYGIAFNNSGGCQVDTVKNIIINEPTEVSNSALDLTVVEPSCNTTIAQILVNFELDGVYLYQILDTAGVLVDSITTDAGQWTTELDTLGVFELVVTNSSNPGLCEPNSRNFNIERSGGFTATASDVQDIVCHGDQTGSAVITLQGISTGFYSVDNGVIWNEFTSGNRITGLPEVNNILVSDEAGTSDCELSVPVGIEYLSDPIELTGGEPIIISEASCDESETNGVIEIPAISGGVEPYTFEIDGSTVELDGNRQISGLNKLTQTFTIIDDSGCSVDFEINNMLAPNQISASVTEINEEENRCIEQPEGIRISLSTFTVNNIPGPFTLILNKADEEEVVELPLNLDSNNGDPVFFVGPDYDLNFTFEKGQQYNWTIRSNNSEQSCSTDGTIRIDDGAIIPTFELEGIDAACNDGSGALKLYNIEGDMNLPVEYQIFEGNASTPTVRINEPNIPVTGEFEINPNNYGSAMGFVSGGYNVRIVQRPDQCANDIISETKNVQIQQPSGNLVVELVPEPNLPPGIERTLDDMNPRPTSRKDRADGSISVRISSESGAEAYYALLSLAPEGRVSGAAPYIFNQDTVELIPNESYTFENLSAGTYIIEYFDSFGRCVDQVRIVQDVDGATDGIYVGFDERPFIPNIFTPNNDRINDYFKILNLPDNGAELIVTNRNGTIVYQNSSYGPEDRENNLWDGGDNPDGIYFYKLDVNGSIQTGWVEILRGRR